MFEGLEFGGMGNNPLEIIKEFFSTEGAEGRTRLTPEQIKLMLVCRYNIKTLKRYYGDDFAPLNELDKLIEDILVYTISLDGMSRKEAKESLQGMMDVAEMKSVVSDLNKKDKK